MKMERIRLIGPTTVDIPLLRGSRSGPFALRSAEGLGPSDVTAKMTRSTTGLQASHRGNSIALRRLTLMVDLRPDWVTGETVDVLRDRLYSLMGYLIKVEVYDPAGFELAITRGVVVKIEPALFTKEPAVQVIIDCNHAHWMSSTGKTLEMVPVTVGNESQFTIDNVGSAPAGFAMGYRLAAPHTGPLHLRENKYLGAQLKVDGISWAAGDYVLFNTEPGEEDVMKSNNSGQISVLNNLSADSTWFPLQPGINKLVTNVTSFDVSMIGPFLEYTPLYWGI